MKLNDYFKNESGYADQRCIGEGLTCIAMAMERFSCSGMDVETYQEIGRALTDVIHQMTPYLTETNQKRFELYLVKKTQSLNKEEA